MNNDKVTLEGYLVLFLRQKRLYTIWKIGIKVFLCSSLLSLIAALFVSPGLLLWWISPLILLFPLLSVSISILLRPVNLIKFCADLDEVVFRDQSLTVWYEMILSGDSVNLYYKILKDRVLRDISRIKPKSVYTLHMNKTVMIAFVLAFITILVFSYSIINRPLPDYKLAADNLHQAARRLAVKEDLEDTFSTAIDKMNQLEEKLDEEKGSSTEIEKTIEDLSNEITKQLSALRRDTLSSLIDEKRIDSDTGFNLNKLLREDLSIDESRQFVLDLLTDNSISGNQRNYIQKSYEDYIAGPDNADTSELAEDLIDSFAPEFREKAEAMEDAGKSLNEALEKLRASDGMEMGFEDDRGQPGISGQQEGASREVPDDPDQNKNSASASGGSEENQSSDRDDFTPYEQNGIQASLPEGELIIDSDTGILRLEGDEELELERIEGIYDDTPFEEGLIRDYEIPSEMRGLVEKYFTLIGEMSTED